MKVDGNSIKQLVSTLSRHELEQIIIKLSKRKEVAEFLLVNYFNKESGETDLFEKTKTEIQALQMKCYKGFSEDLQLANMLSACIKKVNEFTMVSKNKKLEADLLLYILDIPFGHSKKNCWEPVSLLTIIKQAYW